MKLQVNERRRFWWTLSGSLLAASAIAIAICFVQFGAPVRLGLDFLGGTRLQLELDCTPPAPQSACDSPIDAAEVRAVLADRGLENASVQLLDRAPQPGEAGSGRGQVLAVRSQDLDVDERTALIDALTAEIGRFDPTAIQIDTVGPVLGQQTLVSGVLALILALAGIVVYLSLRFQFDYAVFAIAALFHDVTIVVGVFALLGLVARVETDSLFVVALLTIIGFSVNDTVVIYDRVRENLKATPDRPILQTVDDAVDQTLWRSINTTVSTLLAVVAIFLFGGATLRDFSLALIIGFISGSYSSIFVASTLLSWWRSRPGYVPPKPRSVEDSGLPAMPEDAPPPQP